MVGKMKNPTTDTTPTSVPWVQGQYKRIPETSDETYQTTRHVLQVQSSIPHENNIFVHPPLRYQPAAHQNPLEDLSHGHDHTRQEKISHRVCCQIFEYVSRELGPVNTPLISWCNYVRVPAAATVRRASCTRP